MITAGDKNDVVRVVACAGCERLVEKTRRTCPYCGGYHFVSDAQTLRRAWANEVDRPTPIHKP